MKEFRLCFAFFVALALFSFTRYASADDGQWGTDANPLYVDWIGDDSSLDLTHNDADPYKGWATLYLENTCGTTWGDFHLKIIGDDHFDHVNFCDNWGGDYAYEPQLWVKEGSTYVQDTDLTWVISNDSGHATIDLYFYDDPIATGEQAYIKVYTDNTYYKYSSFQLGGYPTPVPEPATLALAGVGALVLLAARRRTTA